ncbi:hypothetical protein PPERSA_01450 [Pseudocohnilembus persalinus]|uniref:PH domain-containing protein n=1 Tax=Pseudocohnilembus persalinus TaxID=266149 RepID=A0A0V0QHA0_PSEPJ|nr:hypothetical protein PPERSA_01450 [Pseudocohnilembus persalinus]|eukprot:KRX01547.1 hypothetical protein PPERSA_01450 [Pseudocohnilembus persalinus]
MDEILQARVQLEGILEKQSEKLKFFNERYVKLMTDVLFYYSEVPKNEMDKFKFQDLDSIQNGSDQIHNQTTNSSNISQSLQQQKQKQYKPKYGIRLNQIIDVVKMEEGKKKKELEQMFQIKFKKGDLIDYKNRKIKNIQVLLQEQEDQAQLFKNSYRQQDDIKQEKSRKKDQDNKNSKQKKEQKIVSQNHVNQRDKVLSWVFKCKSNIERNQWVMKILELKEQFQIVIPFRLYAQEIKEAEEREKQKQKEIEDKYLKNLKEDKQKKNKKQNEQFEDIDEDEEQLRAIEEFKNRYRKKKFEKSDQQTDNFGQDEEENDEEEEEDDDEYDDNDMSQQITYYRKNDPLIQAGLHLTKQEKQNQSVNVGKQNQQNNNQQTQLTKNNKNNDFFKKQDQIMEVSNSDEFESGEEDSQEEETDVKTLKSSLTQNRKSFKSDFLGTLSLSKLKQEKEEFLEKQKQEEIQKRKQEEQEKKRQLKLERKQEEKEKQLEEQQELLESYSSSSQHDSSQSSSNSFDSSNCSSQLENEQKIFEIHANLALQDEVLTDENDKRKKKGGEFEKQNVDQFFRLRQIQEDLQDEASSEQDQVIYDEQPKFNQNYSKQYQSINLNKKSYYLYDLKNIFPQNFDLELFFSQEQNNMLNLSLASYHNLNQNQNQQQHQNLNLKKLNMYVLKLRPSFILSQEFSLNPDFMYTISSDKELNEGIQQFNSNNSEENYQNYVQELTGENQNQNMKNQNYYHQKFVFQQIQQSQIEKMQLGVVCKQIRLQILNTFIQDLDNSIYIPISGHDLSHEIHRRGLNIKYLGIICKKCESIYVKKICRQEMIARCLKKVIQAKLTDYIINKEINSSKEEGKVDNNQVNQFRRNIQQFFEDKVLQNGNNKGENEENEDELLLNFTRDEHKQIKEEKIQSQSYDMNAVDLVTMSERANQKIQNLVFSRNKRDLQIKREEKLSDKSKFQEEDYKLKKDQKPQEQKQQRKEIIQMLKIKIIIQNQLYGEKCLENLDTQVQLAQIYYEDQQIEEAKQNARIILEKYKDIPYIQMVYGYCILIRCSLSNEDFQAIQNYCQQALQIIQFNLGGNHPISLEIYNTMVQCCTKLTDDEGIIFYLEKIEDCLKNSIGMNSEYYGDCILDIGDQLFKMEQVLQNLEVIQ